MTPDLYVVFVWFSQGCIFRVPLCSFITCCNGFVSKVLNTLSGYSALSYNTWILEEGKMEKLLFACCFVDTK